MYNNIEDELDYYIEQYTLFEDYELVAFLENEEDQRFWEFIFDKSIPNKRVAFNSYSKEGKQGKKTVLKYKTAILNQNAKAIICIDSDFDYLTNNTDINENPFIFQTYTYSVENYACCAKSLDNLCKTLLINSSNFNFEIFLKSYSSIIEELLILDIVLKEENTKINDFYKYDINIETINNNGNKFLQNLEDKIDTKVIEIKTNFTINTASVAEIKNKVIQDELLNSDFLHLYINGHIIFNLTKNILTTLYNGSHKQNLKKLKESFSGQHLNDKINELNNKNLDIETALKLNFSNCYFEEYCPSFDKVIDEIKQTIV
jgi:hypothetical protein